MRRLMWISRVGAVCLLPAVVGAQSFSLGTRQNSRLVELSHNVAPHIQDNRVPSPGERLGAALDQTRSTLASLENRIRQGDKAVDAAGVVSEEQKKLAVLDEAYQTEFADIESKMRKAGLPAAVLAQKLAAWHDFTANYRRRMDATQAGFEKVRTQAAGRDARSLLAELANLRESMGAASTTPQNQVSYSYSHPAPDPGPRTAISASLGFATDPPTPDDLSATNIIRLTPDIMSRAAGYGSSPAALFAFVYNEIQFVPYVMLVQNSEAVLWSGRGNDSDQATLLIALLRASNIPARYVMGTINVPVADAISWTGAKDKAGTAAILNFDAAIADQGTSFAIAHVWVEAWLPNGSSNAWIPMTPSIKRQTFQPGLMLARPVFNRTQFLSTVQTPLATEIYDDQLHTAFAQAYPGHDFTELAYTGTIVPTSSTTLPSFPYPPTQINMRGSSLPSQLMGVMLAGPNKTVFQTTLVMPEVSLQAITMSYTPASQQDESIITSFGGLANVPVGMVNLMPQLRLDDVVTVTGTTPVQNGGALTLTVTHTGAFATTPNETFVHSATAGENVAVTMGFNQISQALIDARLDRITGELATAAQDDIVRDILALAGWRYFQRTEIEQQRVFSPLQILPSSWIGRSASLAPA